MSRILVLIVLTVAAVGIAYLLQRRRPEPPSAPSYRAPTQIDRSEFAGPEHPILVVVFASTTCSTCPAVWDMVEPLASERVVVERIDVQTDPGRHKRYRIDGVPTTLVVGADGTVIRSFFGPFDPEELESVAGGIADG